MQKDYVLTKSWEFRVYLALFIVGGLSGVLFIILVSMGFVWSFVSWPYYILVTNTLAEHSPVERLQTQWAWTVYLVVPTPLIAVGILGLIKCYVRAMCGRVFSFIVFWTIPVLLLILAFCFESNLLPWIGWHYSRLILVALSVLLLVIALIEESKLLLVGFFVLFVGSLPYLSITHFLDPIDRILPEILNLPPDLDMVPDFFRPIRGLIYAAENWKEYLITSQMMFYGLSDATEMVGSLRPHDV